MIDKIGSWLKPLRIRQVLTVLLAGIFLFISTACSDGAQARTASGVSDNPLKSGRTASEVRRDLPKESRVDAPVERGIKIDNPVEGGINIYSDTDPRKDTSRADAKAKALVDDAERRVDERGNVVDKVQRNLGDFDIGKNAARDAAKLPEKAKSATQDLSTKIKSNVDEAVEAGKEVGSKAQRAAEDTSDSVRSGVNQATKSTQRALEDTADTVR